MTSENERRVIRVGGSDTFDFLQNLVTNDLDRLSEGPVYAALLTPQGKLIADFLVLQDGEALLVDVAEAFADPLVQRLNMYRLRADVRIEPTGIKVRRGTGAAPEGAVADPRHPSLGWRLYGESDGDDGTDFAAIRVAGVIPESGIELGPETYILEAGFDRLNGVDFRKGCYVGQEVTARMKHKTELRKGLIRVDVEGAAPAGTEIEREGKKVGILYTQSDGQAIAYARFDRLAPGMTAGEARVTPAGTARD
ncbi:aminomethyl transferase family protein [Pseudooceanicola batsensis HTCC2597]|uniref:Aminomethyl transferase family protein n=1 Tax=Pseudooceanicola batsensis (strain ATCC BAA-863 / DSM 15984 / KCTC 12145 / HTCC2597) TaxID=252305 RepID=A3TUN5_PSEBH|nr:folate-binding protein YgfZ [Pseudooceanicola batsensis]EAQ04231.1 aminomethyl transferase family protein [Pseudooceanicola batsensis HTCC2597]